MNIEVVKVKEFLNSYAQANNSNQFCKCRNIEQDFIEYLKVCDGVEICDDNEKETINNSHIVVADKGV